METLKQKERFRSKTSLEGELGRLLDGGCYFYYFSKISAFIKMVEGGHWWLHEESVVVDFGDSHSKLRLVVDKNGFKVREQGREKIIVGSRLKVPLEEVPDNIFLLESIGGTKIYLGISQQEGLPSVKKVVVEREVLP